MGAELTKRQAEVLAFIQEYHRDHGFVPSMRDIARHIGVASINSVNDHLRFMEKKGVIRRSPNMARTIVVVAQSEPHDAVSIVERASNLYRLMSATERHAFLEMIGAG